MTTIEKLARALSKAPHSDEVWKTFTGEARAAIEAMRDPSPEMIQAAARGVSDSFHEEGYMPEFDDPSVWNEFVKAGERAWINAIDAALKEE